jgi:phenylalanyl-tRNA synthetase beta subunit
VGKKSIAFRVKIQPQNKSLTTEEIDTLCDKIIKELTEKIGGVLRDK